MLTFKRALIAAACFICVFYMLSRSHTSPGPADAIIQDKVPSTDKLPDASRHGSSTTGTPEAGNKNPSGSGSNGGLAAVGSQKPLQDMSKMTLTEKLAYQHPYDVESKFPAYVWQTWKYTPAHGEFAFREQEATWTQLHPGFTHEVITDEVAASLVKLFYASVPDVLEAYEALPLPVLKADFFRYLILLARGGVYSDIDTSALKSALEWIPESVPRDAVGLVVGIEADPDRPDWHDWYSRRIQFCQWTIQSKPGHPVLREVVAAITGETLRRKRAGMLSGVKDSGVIEFTGPAVWTDVIFSYFNDARYFDMSNSKGPIDWHNFTGMTATKKVGDVIVLPITSFSPGVGQMGAGDYDDPMAFVRHAFEGTWKPENQRHIGAK